MYGTLIGSTGMQVGIECMGHWHPANGCRLEYDVRDIIMPWSRIQLKLK